MQVRGHIWLDGAVGVLIMVFVRMFIKHSVLYGGSVCCFFDARARTRTVIRMRRARPDAREPWTRLAAGLLVSVLWDTWRPCR